MSMSQSRKRSVKEAFINLMIGYGVNWSGNVIFIPLLWHKDHPMLSAHLLGIAFTVISFVRQYIIRRCMAKGDKHVEVHYSQGSGLTQNSR